MATNRAKGHRGRDIAPKVLGDFVKSLAHLASEGKPLETLLKDAIKEQGILKVLEVMARYNPKQIDATIEDSTKPDAALLTPEQWEAVRKVESVLNVSDTQH